MEIVRNLIVLFLLLVLNSCGTINQKLSPDTFYKRDMLLTIDGGTYEGVAVLPERLTGVYSFTVEARGDLSLFTLASCVKLQEKERAWGSVSTRIDMGLWERKIVDKRKVSFSYSRNNLERQLDYCYLYLEGLDEAGKHSWAFIDFQDSKTNLPAWVSCNDANYKSDGVSVCQNRKDMWVQMTFEEPVYGKSSCGEEFQGAVHRFQLKPKECTWIYANKNKKVHRLTTLGFEDILLRQ